MKKIILVLFLGFALFSCKSENQGSGSKEATTSVKKVKTSQSDSFYELTIEGVGTFKNKIEYNGKQSIADIRATIAEDSFPVSEETLYSWSLDVYEKTGNELELTLNTMAVDNNKRTGTFPLNTKLADSKVMVAGLPVVVENTIDVEMAGSDDYTISYNSKFGTMTVKKMEHNYESISGDVTEVELTAEGEMEGENGELHPFTLKLNFYR